MLKSFDASDEPYSIIVSILIFRVYEELLGPLGLAVNQDMEEGKLGKVIVFAFVFVFEFVFAFAFDN